MNTRKALWIGLIGLSLACRPAAENNDHAHPDEDESWAITAWGEQFEIFAEMDPLAVGESSTSHTHVTILEDFSPISEGTVSAILRSRDGQEQVFPQPEILRSGIYNVEITPSRAGDFEFLFRVETEAGTEEIPSATIRLGESSEILQFTAGSEAAMAAGSDEDPLSFLKEQQWKTAFATEWVSEGEIHRSMRSSARIRPVAGGEVLLTAPVPGVVNGEPWPYLGMAAKKGTSLFRITPWVDSDQSMADLEAMVEILASELLNARRRQSRLEDLSDLGATSTRELEDVGAQVVGLEARFEAATLDLEMAKAGRMGGAAGASRIPIQAPFEGQVAQVFVTPGEAVAAGSRLARLIKPEPLWIEVALRPDSAAQVSEVSGLIIENRSSALMTRFADGEVRLVSISPSVDPETGKVMAIFEVEADTSDLRIGSRAQAEILLPGRSEGVVVPISSLVDDGGIPVVYLQVDGEGFIRQRVTVVQRQGDQAQVTGLLPGGRLVTEGGNAIRRATLVSSDVGEGHVH